MYRTLLRDVRSSRALPTGPASLYTVLDEPQSRGGIRAPRTLAVMIMQTISIAKILLLFCVQAVFLAVITALHILFTLPHARMEGVDRLALAGEAVPLQCVVAVAPPGPRPIRGEGVHVSFSVRQPAPAAPQRLPLGTVAAGAGGVATLPWKAPAEVGTVTEIDPEIEGEGSLVLQPIKPRPYILVTTLSEGTIVIVCDVDALFPDHVTWQQLRDLPPPEWPFDPDAASALDAATQARSRQIVYVAPGASLLTAEVRAALHARHFPRGPILFPEAAPGAGSTAQALDELFRKWPYTKCVIFRRSVVAEAAAAKKLPALAVGRAPAGALALPQVRPVPTWGELAGAVDSL